MSYLGREKLPSRAGIECVHEHDIFVATRAVGDLVTFAGELPGQGFEELVTATPRPLYGAEPDTDLQVNSVSRPGFSATQK
jgi:hypothetical protein